MGSKPWSPWYTEISLEVGRKSDSLQCSLCGRIFVKRLERQLSHLGYEGRSGKRTGGIGLCTKLTSRVHNLFKIVVAIIRNTMENFTPNIVPTQSLEICPLGTKPTQIKWWKLLCRIHSSSTTDFTNSYCSTSPPFSSL